MEPNIRRCLACRKTAPKSEFWRIVRNFPTHDVSLDTGAGRSAYVCPKEHCLKLAQKKNRLGRALKVSIPDSIHQTLLERLANPPESTSSNSQPTHQNS